MEYISKKLASYYFVHKFVVSHSLKGFLQMQDVCNIRELEICSATKIAGR
jgi:hypothetical protein